ncbi:MAG TPA: lysylphosphatidylglycerol synthase transmembrane domain-containing protein [Aliidongia sp.]|nr:lysylphosphatidylglycerol synthase transmembrane domain-containing protein [Aliidongia sp.]
MSSRTNLLLRIAVSLLVIVALFHFIDFSLVFDRLRQLSPLFLVAIFALVLAQNVLFAVRWSAIADFCDARVGALLAIRFTIISMFFNQTLPGTLGGDSIRVLLSVGEGVSVKRAFLSVVIDRILALGVLIGLVAASLPILAVSIAEPRLIYGMAFLAAILVSGIVAFLMLPLLIPHRWRLWRLVRVLIELAGTTSSLLGNRKLVVTTVPLAIAGHLLSGGVAVLCAKAMHIAVDPVLTVILLLPALLAMAIPVSIAGWGVREGAMVVALGQIGVHPADALALSVAFGFIFMLAGIPGGLLWLVPRPGRVPIAHAKNKEIA